MLLKRETVNFEFCLAIYKTRNVGTGNSMRGMFTRILGNLLGDYGKCYHFNISVKVREDLSQCSKRFRECSRRFRGSFRNIPGMLLKIPGNVTKVFGDCY